MIKKIAELYINKSKNKDFTFDKNLSDGAFASLIINKIISFIRGLQFTFNNRKTNLVFVGKKLKLINKKNIRIGNNVSIGDYVTLSALGTGKLSIMDNANVGSFSQLIISTSYNNIGSHIFIGNNVGFGEFSYLGGAGGLEIGDNTIIGQYFSAHPENHNFEDSYKLIREQGVSRKGIKIGRNCWIGAKVTILDGVIIGDNCVIASGSVVNKSYEKNCLIGGVPSRVLKKI
jgi:acetyltransferase-like isoleucine patch superfamily enzyme